MKHLAFAFTLTAVSVLSFFTACTFLPTAQKSRLEVSEEDFGAYLLVYFKDETHSLYFAISSDGYTFTDVNHGNPIFDGKNLAEQKGVRDPFIGRGPDGFYMALTDLHIFAQRSRIRDTQWLHPQEEYGWGNNRALVLMKSTDLINWSVTDYRLDQAFPEDYAEIGCSWAPEIIYDPEKDSMMVYFTLRIKNGKERLYYAHTDKDFTKFIEKPQLIGMKAPEEKTYIDGDITHANGKYYMFLASNGIKLAVSDHLRDGYVYDDKTIVTGEGSCEAPNVWKRIGTDKYVLMYDNFQPMPNEMAFQETTDFKTFTPLGRFNKGVMKTTNFRGAKHGAVIPLTKAEAQRLATHWKVEKY